MRGATFISGSLLDLLLFVCLFCFLGPHHLDVPPLGVELELWPLTYTTATTMPDGSYIYDLHHSSRQHWILNCWSRPGIEYASSWILVGFETHWAMTGNTTLGFWGLGFFFSYFFSFFATQAVCGNFGARDQTCATQQWPEPRQWEPRTLNWLGHQRTPANFLYYIVFSTVKTLKQNDSDTWEIKILFRSQDYGCIFFFFFCPHPWHENVPGPGTEPKPQQW